MQSFSFYLTSHYLCMANKGNKFENTWITRQARRLQQQGVKQMMFKGRVICSRGAERFIEILSFIERKSMTCLLRDIFYDQNTK